MRSLDRSEADWRLLLLHLTLGGFVVLLIGALATGATHYLERYMHPFFLLTPLWPAWARGQGANASRRLVILGTLLVATAVLVVPLTARHGPGMPQMPRRYSI